MSRENVGLVRRAYSVPYASAQWVAIIEDAVAADCVLDDRTLPEVAAGVTGPEAMRAAAAYMTDAFEDVSYEIEDVLELDDGRVAVRLRASGRGRGSRMRIDGTLGHVLTLREGKLSRLDVYGTWADALEAVRLSE